jgi:hypothetical protein
MLMAPCVLAWSATAVEARLTKIRAGPPTLIDLSAFGATGPYLKIAGTFEGEIDPTDSHNAVIAGIGLAPTVNGRVHNTSTFYILRPADLSKDNGKLYYDFGNRGGKRILQWFNDGAPTDDPRPLPISGTGSSCARATSLPGAAGRVT